MLFRSCDWPSKHLAPVFEGQIFDNCLASSSLPFPNICGHGFQVASIQHQSGPAQPRRSEDCATGETRFRITSIAPVHGTIDDSLQWADCETINFCQLVFPVLMAYRLRLNILRGLRPQPLECGLTPEAERRLTRQMEPHTSWSTLPLRYTL